MKTTPIKICKKCGKEIFILPQRLYRSITVDAEAVTVIPDMSGECFIRVDGSKMRGREVPMGSFPAAELKAEYVYRPHAKTCGVDE